MEKYSRSTTYYRQRLMYCTGSTLSISILHEYPFNTIYYFMTSYNKSELDLMTGGTASSIIQLLHRSLPAQSSSVFSSTTIHCFCTLCHKNLNNHWMHRQVSFCTILL